MAEVVARLKPNSLSIELKKTPNEWRVPNSAAPTTRAAMTIIHP